MSERDKAVEVLRDAIARGYTQGFLDGTEYEGTPGYEAQRATAESKANKCADVLTTWLRNAPNNADIEKARAALSRPETQRELAALAAGSSGGPE